MIAVIADDFTGAAEIGGIGLRYQLKVEIATAVKPDSDADLLVIATDNRSKTEQEAVAEINQITAQLNQLNPEWIYKKIDSVLRGHVTEELSAQMQFSGKSKALVIPANPDLGRTIKDGTYYVDGKKLHETNFRNDPEYALTSSNVLDILGKGIDINLVTAKPGSALPATGMIIGDASTADDLRLWAEQADDRMLLAGASGFFSAWLAHKGYGDSGSLAKKNISFDKKRALLVCGSSFVTSREMIKKALAAGASVSLMPAGLIAASGEQWHLIRERWTSEIVSLLALHRAVIVSTNPFVEYKKEQAGIIRRNMAIAAGKTVQQAQPEELILEGGSTASAVLKELGLEKFYPQQELAPGVIRMCIPGSNALHITLKPGSYEWPAFLWKNE